MNSDLLVMLEIFTGDESNNARIIQNCNGDVALKEMVHYDSCDKLAGLLNSISYKAPLALLNRFNEPENYKLNAP